MTHNIRKRAPKGATHFNDSTGVYYRQAPDGSWECNTIYSDWVSVAIDEHQPQFIDLTQSPLKTALAVFAALLFVACAVVLSKELG